MLVLLQHDFALLRPSGRYYPSPNSKSPGGVAVCKRHLLVVKSREDLRDTEKKFDGHIRDIFYTLEADSIFPQ